MELNLDIGILEISTNWISKNDENCSKFSFATFQFRSEKLQRSHDTLNFDGSLNFKKNSEGWRKFDEIHGSKKINRPRLNDLYTETQLDRFDRERGEARILIERVDRYLPARAEEERGAQVKGN